LKFVAKFFISLHNAEALTEGTETEEVALEKAHLGVLYEREWYLRKLRALEAAIGPPPPHEQTAYVSSQDTTAVSAFTRAVRSILYEDSNEFSLVGFRWH